MRSTVRLLTGISGIKTTMSCKPTRNLAKLFYILFSLCFIWLLNHIITGGYYGYREVPLLLVIICALALLLLFWHLIKKYEAILAKHSFKITTVFLSLMFVAQILLGYLLRYQPIFDVDAIYGGAIEWVETGSFNTYYEYFSYFPNNIGGLRFFYWVFKIARSLGCRDYYMTAVTVNSLLSLCTMYLSGEVSGKLIGEQGRFMAYVLFLISLPFYFIAPAFYTDALAMPFPILTYWLYLLAKERDQRRDRAALYVLMGFSGAIGTLIKPVVAIALMAIVIDAVLTWDWKRAILMAVTMLLVYLMIGASLNSTIYRHLDRNEAEANNTPILHWVMMGLSRNGMYNPEDYEFTRSFDNKEEQTVALLDEIKERIRSRGFNGMVELLTTKGDICFGDGTYGLSDCLGGISERETWLRELLLSAGEYYHIYQHITAGVLLALYILVIVSALQEICCTNSPTLSFLVPRLAVFGLLLFLICWEARWRYFSSFIPLVFISSLLGIEQFSNMLTIVRNRLCPKREKTKASIFALEEENTQSALQDKMDLAVQKVKQTTV